MPHFRGPDLMNFRKVSLKPGWEGSGDAAMATVDIAAAKTACS